MASGFIDSASIHGALAALSRSDKKDWSEWDQQSLLSATYLLLQPKMKVVPGPGLWRGADGPLEYLARLSNLEISTARPSSSSAEQMTKAWVQEDTEDVKKRFDALKSNPTYETWAANQIELFWLHHVNMHGALFDSSFIPELSLVLGYEKTDLESVYETSKDTRVIKRWTKSPGVSEEQRIAENGWLLSSFLRGRYHELVASANNLQLASHPFRQGAGLTLNTEAGPYRELTNSEIALVNIILGSALIESDPKRRIKTWVSNLDSVQKVLPGFRLISFPTLSLAENHAVLVAKNARLSTQPARLSRMMDAGLAISVGKLVAMTVSPWWVAAGSAALTFGTQTYRHAFGKSAGDHLSALLSTRKRFKALARTGAGRIERYFCGR